MATQIGSFFKKTYKKANKAPVAFAFLFIALVGTFVAFSLAKNVIFRDGSERFDVISKELRAVVVSRVNRTIDLPLAISKNINLEATKGELDVYLNSLDLDSRYPGVREAGIYATSGGNLKRLYHYAVSGEQRSIKEVDLKFSVSSLPNEEVGVPLLLKLNQKDVRYVILVPVKKDNYFYMVFDATALLGNLFVENSIFNNIDYKIYDTTDSEFPIFESNSIPFSPDKYSFKQDQLIKIGLYPWNITTSGNLGQMLSITAQKMPVVILLSGLTIAFLMFGILLSLSWSRKNAILIAEEMTKSLRLSEEKYRSIFESLQDVYYRTDKGGLITTISPSIENYIGIKPEILIGKSASSFYKNPKERDTMLVELSLKGTVKDYPLTLIGKNGSIIYCSLNARILRSSSGETEGVEGLLRDISERKLANDSLQTKTKDLERLNNLMIGRELRMIELKDELKKYGKS